MKCSASRKRCSGSFLGIVVHSTAVALPNVSCSYRASPLSRLVTISRPLRSVAAYYILFQSGGWTMESTMAAQHALSVPEPIQSVVVNHWQGRAVAVAAELEVADLLANG